jgi:hypothetical protein
MDEEISDLFFYVSCFFVFVFLIHFLILQVCNDFVGEQHFDTGVGVIGVVSNGVPRGFPIPWVHDSSIFVTYGGPPFDILIGIPFSRCNIIIASIDWEKIVSQVHGVGVSSMKFWHWLI